MRLIVDAMIVVMLLALMGGAVWYVYEQQQEGWRLRKTVRSLDAIRDEVALQAAMALPDGEVAVQTYPASIDPQWFKENKPVNALAEPFRPWMDTAASDDWSKNPADPVLDRLGQATFWYNPNNGAVRARVPRQLTDSWTLSLYNRINRTSLAALPVIAEEEDDDALPVPVEREPVKQAEARGGEKRTDKRPEKPPVVDSREKVATNKSPSPRPGREVTQAEPVSAEPVTEQWEPVVPKSKEPAPPPRRRPSLRNDEE